MKLKIPVSISCCLAFAAFTAGADSITIHGKQYNDVLIYKSRSTYYVKIPKEGHSTSIPVADVDETTVTINDDPYYRDQLKELYDSVKSGQTMAQSDVPSDPAFRVQESSNESAAVDASAFLGSQSVAAGSSGSKGLGIPRQMLQGMLTGAGAQFSGTGNTVTGKMPDGTTFQLIGPAENLTTIKIKSSFPEAQKAQMQQSVAQISMLTGASAPWAAGWIQSNMQTLLNGGSITKTQNGVNITIKVNYSGGQGTFDFSLGTV
jgi:hypothetical protein